MDYYLLIAYATGRGGRNATLTRITGAVNIQGFIVTWLEPFMHVTAYGVALGTSLTALFMRDKGLYNATTWDCWIISYPIGCNANRDTCLCGASAPTFQLYFNYVITWTIIPLVALAMFLIASKVSSVERASSRWQRQWTKRSHQNDGPPDSSNTPTPPAVTITTTENREG
jgi:hypothetical protein